MGGDIFYIRVMVTGGYLWIVLCRHQTAHMQICLLFLCQKNNNNNNNKFVDGDKPTPKKKEKNQLRVFWGVGGQIMPISSSHYLT